MVDENMIDLQNQLSIATEEAQHRFMDCVCLQNKVDELNYALKVSAQDCCKLKERLQAAEIAYKSADEEVDRLMAEYIKTSASLADALDKISVLKQEAEIANDAIGIRDENAKHLQSQIDTAAKAFIEIADKLEISEKKVRSIETENIKLERLHASHEDWSAGMIAVNQELHAENAALKVQVKECEEALRNSTIVKVETVVSKSKEEYFAKWGQNGD
jgi:chromosome segregation ATPase